MNNKALANLFLGVCIRRHPWRLGGLWLLVAALCLGDARAQDPPPPPADANSGTDEPAAVPDELLMFQDVPVVVSAARRPQPANWLSVPVSIVTAEDIHYSGLRSLNDVLQFTPGVDALKLDRNRTALGVHGLHEYYSDRLLSLVDGRSADSSVFGGPLMERLSMPMEDIKRVEVVRAPGGAAWGANAFTGVINVITKDPEDVLGWFATTRWNHFGESYSHIRWGAKGGPWSWKVSLNYADNKTSDDVLHHASFTSSMPAINGLMGFDDFRARDFSRTWRHDTKAVYRPSDRTKWTFGLGGTHAKMGDYLTLTYWPRDNVREDCYRAFARAETKLDGGRSAHFQWSGKYVDRAMGTERYRVGENDLEAQYNFALAENHKTSVGGNVRGTYIDTQWGEAQQNRYAGGRFDEYWLGLFAIDRWQITKRWALEGQLRADWYSETYTDWSGRLSSLYALDEAGKHVFRLSAAKAFRAPLISLRRVRRSNLRLPLPGPPAYGFNLLLPKDDMDNEQTWSLEAGYTARLAKWLTFRADGYYQRFEDLIGFEIDSTALQWFIRPKNIGGADSYGGEVELEAKGKAGTIGAWYAYNGFQEQRDRQNLRAFLPAPHKVGLRGRLFLPHGWTLNANYKYTDLTPGDGSSVTMANTSHRLDLTVAKEIADGHGEVMFGVSDVLNKEHDAIIATSQFANHKIPGRTFFVRFQWKF